MELKDFIETAQAQALADKLRPSEEVVWLRICRSYSKTFHTPLHMVVNELDPEFVIKNYYGDQFDDVDVEEKIDTILDAIYSLEDPNYAREKEEDLTDFIEDIEAEEEERVRNNESLLKHLAKKQRKEKMEDIIKKEMKDLPKSGGVNFKYMNQDEES